MCVPGSPLGSPPVIGRIGRSCIAPQPGPAIWVRLNPRNWVALKLYPPPRGRLGLVSGLHCTIPNGISTPGKSLPPPVDMTRASTTDAGSLTRAALFVAAFATPVRPTATIKAAKPIRPARTPLYRMVPTPIPTTLSEKANPRTPARSMDDGQLVRSVNCSGRVRPGSPDRGRSPRTARPRTATPPDRTPGSPPPTGARPAGRAGPGSPSPPPPPPGPRPDKLRRYRTGDSRVIRWFAPTGGTRAVA